MNFNGFTEDDFNVFSIDGLEDRMEALIETVRPKLDALGTHFSPTLSTMTGDEMFPHVAKHARRSVNPPDDTWVAFANNKRGYKKHPHFQIGLWETHVFVWFAMIYEAPAKEEYGKKLEQNIDRITDIIPRNFVWSGDHTKPEVQPFSEMDKEELTSLFKRLQTVKKAEILCGIQIPREKAVKLSGDETIEIISDAFVKLLPLYNLR
ncbi:YktB family protein [Bacillus salacetis]|uniref:YktB family protein n=1 Tax=Bacillus salacetis TaxID=2315464 RepID=UPI003B9E936F